MLTRKPPPPNGQTGALPNIRVVPTHAAGRYFTSARALISRKAISLGMGA
jgi:hypothetical protein